MDLAKYIPFLLVFSLAVPLTAMAERGQREQRIKQQASRYFSRGEILFDEGNYSKAAEAFSLAYEIYPHPSALVNIGLCYERAGWIPRAVETYREYVSLAKGAPDEKAIRKKIKKLLKLVSELVITCPPVEGNCAIQVEGLERGNAPVTVLVEPGRRTVAAYVNGAEVYSTTIAVDAGESRDLEVVPEIEGAEQPPTPTTTDTNPGFPESTENDADETPRAGLSPEAEVDGDVKKGQIKMSPAFWVASSVTVAAGALTIVFGVKYLQDMERFEDSDNTDLKASADGERDKLATNILIGVTSAAAVVAISFAIRDIWFSDKKDKAKTDLTLGPGLGLGFQRSF